MPAFSDAYIKSYESKNKMIKMLVYCGYYPKNMLN